MTLEEYQAEIAAAAPIIETDVAKEITKNVGDSFYTDSQPLLAPPTTINVTPLKKWIVVDGWKGQTLLPGQATDVNQIFEIELKAQGVIPE